MKFSLKWESEKARHTEEYNAPQFNLWRDILPDEMMNGLMGGSAGESLEVEVTDRIPSFRPGEVLTFQRSRLSDRAPGNPRAGRFYPKGLLHGITGVFPQNVEPFRCVTVENGHIQADLNHPLSRRTARLSATVMGVADKKIERGGTVTDWVETISQGPGMQARWLGNPTDFFSDEPFLREDEAPDERFYDAPRFVQHIDAAAVDVIQSLYGGLLQDGMHVLDLMSSWTSHIPDGRSLGRLSGLGMNLAELEGNALLSDRVVHDLNANPTLPYPTGAFDAVLCTVSVEYLNRPLAVFEEMGRVLKPGGLAVMTFSNRWFPPKAIRIWKELHEFERMGLVLEYFERSGKFHGLETYSMRGIPRPRDDRYFPQMRFSDPVYAVWGRSTT
ncbi:methyltransferase domain-containing protein [Desulfococcus sp.]|uniref:methyltransferase domain-containing protein n=1 Tax=Desulfococcus sp. TaxID=2025834 RepID=UPI003594258B